MFACVCIIYDMLPCWRTTLMIHRDTAFNLSILYSAG